MEDKEGAGLFVLFPEKVENEKASDYIKRLEGTGEYIFHGSPSGNIKELETRLAKEVSADPWGNDEAVYAVPGVIAVGRAILPPRGNIIGKWSIASSSDPLENGGPKVWISPNVQLGEGSVYVL
ncbi:MAG: hypothetical protein Q7S03_02370 [bacterium]|nr:hypothetical protein [bacterium]